MPLPAVMACPACTLLGNGERLLAAQERALTALERVQPAHQLRGGEMCQHVHPVKSSAVALRWACIPLRLLPHFPSCQMQLVTLAMVPGLLEPQPVCQGHGG